TNAFQRSNVVAQIAVNTGGISVINSGIANGTKADSTPGVLDARRAAVTKLMGIQQTNLISAALADTTKTAIADHTLLQGVLRSAPSLTTAFPSTTAGARLGMVAKLISVAPTLGLKRQIFFVQVGGFDTHSGQGEAHAPLLAELSKSMKA